MSNHRIDEGPDYQVSDDPENCCFHIYQAEKRRSYLSNAIFGYCHGRCCFQASEHDGKPFRQKLKDDLLDTPLNDQKDVRSIVRIQAYVINRIAHHQALILNLLGQNEDQETFVIGCLKIHMIFPREGYSQLQITTKTVWRPGRELVENVELAQPLSLQNIVDLCQQVSDEYGAENAHYFYLSANCHVLVTRLLLALQLPLGLQLGSTRVMFSMMLELAWKLIFIVLAGLIFCGMIALFSLQVRESFDSLHPLSDLGDVVNCTVENDNFQNCLDGWGTCKIVCNQHRSVIEPPISLSGSCYGPELYGCNLVVSYSWNSSLFSNVLVELKAHKIFDCSFGIGDRRKATIQQCCGLHRVRHCVIDPANPLNVLYISPRDVYRLQGSKADFLHLFFILSMVLIGSTVFIFSYTIFQSLPIVRYGIFCGWIPCSSPLGIRRFLITRRCCPCLTFRWVYSPITAFILSWLIIWWSSSSFIAAFIAGLANTKNFARLFVWLWFVLGMLPIFLVLALCCCSLCACIYLCCKSQEAYEQLN